MGLGYSRVEEGLMKLLSWIASISSPILAIRLVRVRPCGEGARAGGRGQDVRSNTAHLSQNETPSPFVIFSKIR